MERIIKLRLAQSQVELIIAALMRYDGLGVVNYNTPDTKAQMLGLAQVLQNEVTLAQIAAQNRGA